MDQSIVRALTGPRDQPVLTFARTYRAGAADLRDACTDIGRLARWFGTVTGDPARVGDAFEAALSEDPDDRATGRVLRCTDDEVAVEWAWQGEATSVISARFREVDADRSELTLRHELAEPGHAVGYGGGWEQVLQSLARALGAVEEGAAGAVVASDEVQGANLPGGEVAGEGVPSDDEIEAAAVEVWRTITRAPLELGRAVDADPSRVWTALATADGLRSWWWNHWDDVTVEADVRVGGAYRIEAPGAGLVLDGRYLDVEPPAAGRPGRLAMTWRWADADGTSADEAVEIRVEHGSGEAAGSAEAAVVAGGPADGSDARGGGPGGSFVVVRHSGPWADDAPASSYRQGWEFTLGALAAAV
ncbi:SRPBCC family protein [Georgenia sp. Z1344]|uniref:SRPBCC family protein n=1 Tax=Georgenia sp. Z1344 TaxID=3416706 RepID=UPI003CF746AE